MSVVRDAASAALPRSDLQLARRAWVAAMVAGSMLTASSASAEPSHVVLDRGGSDAGLVRAFVRLAAELRAAGFVVDERTSPRAIEDAHVALQASEDDAASDPSHPFATVLLRRVPNGTATDIWVADHVTRKIVVRRIEGGRGETADGLLAMRVVELMRASLVEPLVVPPPSDAPPAASQPAPDVAAFAAPAHDATTRRADATSTFEIGAGVAALYGGPDIGLAWAPTLHASSVACAFCRASVLVVGPAFGGGIDAREGSASVRQELALAELSLEPMRASWARPFVSAGAGAYHVDVTGTAHTPFTDAHDDAWSALAAAGAGIRLRLAQGAGVTLGARALFALPRPVIDFAGVEVAAIGRPSGMLTLSLDVDL